MYVHQDINTLPVLDLGLSTVRKGRVIHGKYWKLARYWKQILYFLGGEKNTVPGKRWNVHIWIPTVLRMGSSQLNSKLVSQCLTDSINLHGFPGCKVRARHRPKAFSASSRAGSSGADFHQVFSGVRLGEVFFFFQGILALVFLTCKDMF